MTAKIMQNFDYAKGRPIYFIQPDSSLQNAACDCLAEEGCCKAPEGIGEKVPPVGSTSRGKRLLTNLNKSAKHNGSNDRPRDESLGFSMLMATKVLKPQYYTKAKVHRKVQYFVNIGDLIERCLGRIKEREKQDYTYDQD